MPLAKNVAYQGGQATVGYWVLTTITIDFLGNTVWYNFNGYVAKADFDGGKNPMMQLPFTLNGAASNVPAAFSTFIETQARTLAGSPLVGATVTP